MLNQTVLVGRLVSDPTICESKEGKKESVITLAVPRNFKNKQGEYETDFIDCTLYNGIAENTVEYCKKGDMVGVKGRIQWIEGESLKIIAEKLTFLTSKHKED